MKPEAQRIAIAEACGWKKEQYTHRAGCWISPTGVTSCRSILALPDYLTDLNAMQSAVMEKRDVLGGYCMELRRIVRRDTPEEYDVYGDINYYHATAAQRAEAFLRTLNLWTN